MSVPLAYWNGRLVTADAARLPLTDGGFVLGMTSSEQLRTFRGQLFQLDPHLDRLRRTLAVLGVPLPATDWPGLRSAAEELAAANHALLEPDDDLGLAILVTPGTYPAFGRSPDEGGVVAMHTWPLPFHLWSEKYTHGQALQTTEVRQVPAECWPAELKVRSRLHYYLADREAAAREPGARALLLDGEGTVNETATANVLLVPRTGSDAGLVSPPVARILPGISRRFVAERAQALQLSWQDRPFGIDDCLHAAELLLTSTPSAILPATRLNGQAIGDGLPGPVFRRLLDDWSSQVGLDIPGQARRFARRG